MRTIIFQLCLFMLISLSSANTLTLYADSPSYPDNIEDYFCCLPLGPVTFTAISHDRIKYILYDVAEVQAAEWIGPGCTVNNVTVSTVVNGLSSNQSSIYNGNTVRELFTFFDHSQICVITLYESSLNPLGKAYTVLSYVEMAMSILACLWLFYRYYKAPRRPLSLHLIFILSVSDFLYHLFDIPLPELHIGSIPEVIIGSIVLYMFFFSLCWSTTMSIIFMKALSGSVIFRQLTLKTWIWCLLPSLVLAAALSALDLFTAFLASWYWCICIFALPIGITIFCYIRTVRVLRKNPLGVKSKDHALFLYPAVQLFLLLLVSSITIIDQIPILSFEAKRVSGSIFQLLEDLMGFFNALIYLIQKQRKPVVQQVNNEDLSESMLISNNSH